MTFLAETDRLMIRTWNPDTDAEAALQIYSDPEVTRFLISKADSLAEAQQLLHRWNMSAAQWNNGTGFWAIVSRETGEILGTIILLQLRDEANQLTPDYEIGWHLRRSAWGKGYATEAAKAILVYGFDRLQLPAIYAVAQLENQASIRVMQRLGMTSMGSTTRYYHSTLELFKLDAPI